MLRTNLNKLPSGPKLLAKPNAQEVTSKRLVGCLRADVSKEIGDVCTQATSWKMQREKSSYFLYENKIESLKF